MMLAMLLLGVSVAVALAHAAAVPAVASINAAPPAAVAGGIP